MRHTRQVTITVFIALIALGGLFFQQLPVLQAAEIDESATLLLDCSSVSVSFSLEDEGKEGVAPTRDNTGTGFENVILEVKDGAGNILVSYSQLLDVESDETGEFDPSYVFSSAPLFNPVVARVYSPAGNGFEEQELLSATVNCPGTHLYVAPGAGAPGIPDGFVLHTIICDVPVYDTPDGTPVAGSNIRNGQTWYVNPEVVAAGDGSSWTEIFTSGVINGFVPTACVA